MLRALEITCKYGKDGCQITQGPHKIMFHEEECDFRKVSCIILKCGGNFPFRDLSNHLKTTHNFDLKLAREYVVNVQSAFHGDFQIDGLDAVSDVIPQCLFQII